MVGELFPSGEKVVHVDSMSDSEIRDLTRQLLQFTEQHYYLENELAFIEKVVKPQQPGDVILFYGKTNELVGYMRIYWHQLTIDGKLITISSSHTYANQTHNTCFSAARLGLIQTMKYKITHPNEELVHFSSVCTPSKYRWLARLCDDIYPKPDSDVPHSVLHLVNLLKKNNDWTSCAAHPMLIGEQLVRKSRCIPIPTLHDDPLANYYSSLNPDDESGGRALLVYSPLSLGNIGHSIKRLLTQYDHHEILSHPVIASAYG